VIEKGVPLTDTEGVVTNLWLERNAVENANFESKHAAQVVATLGCFDRMIFKGYLPFCHEHGLHHFVDHVLQMKRKDFPGFAEQQSNRLVEHAQQVARRAGVTYQYLQGEHNKEALARRAAHEAKHRPGLLLVLCVLELCPAFKLRQAEGRPRLAATWRPQRVLYYYYQDPDFGLMHVRIQTWFPFTVQVYVNGHDWLAQQLTRRGSGFVQRDNCFTELDDPALAQQLADRFARIDWPARLNRWVRAVNPLLNEPWLCGRGYYWVTDQAEYSTDVIFRSREALAALFPRLLRHATLHFSARDVLTFLGRRLHGRFDGEVLTHCKDDRLPGARIKHRMKQNWLKMYDKFGQVLRVETVINNPREFKVRRRRIRDGRRQTLWSPMNKGVSNLYHYREVSQAANRRYLNALAVVDQPAAAYQQVEQLATPQQVGDRRHAGFNPARRQDVRLFEAILDGDHLVRGFRNADLRRLLHRPTPDPVLRRRQASAISRQLKRLHVRGLIKKIPRTYRWHVAKRGQKLLSAIITLYHQGIALAA
jgi:hypothetical protein